jgi:hypothetical protein
MNERHSLEINKSKRMDSLPEGLRSGREQWRVRSSTSNDSESGFKSDNKGRRGRGLLWCLATNHCGATGTDCLWLILLVVGWLVSDFRLSVDLTTPSDIYLRDTSSSAASGQETINRIICVARAVYCPSDQHRRGQGLAGRCQCISTHWTQPWTP